MSDKECPFCYEPAQTKFQGRPAAAYCVYHSGWYAGVLSCAKVEQEEKQGRLAIEGRSFEDSHIPHAPKLSKLNENK